MKIKSSNDNIIVLTAETQYELASTFLRVQEYYESPEFKDTVFDLEEYMDYYAEKYGNFTYYSDWNGFNVPGNVVRSFFKEFAKFSKQLSQKEIDLFNILAEYIDGDQKFYVIGLWKNDNTVEHEFSHAFYCVDPAYKKEMNALLKNVPEEFKHRCLKVLQDDGYHKSVFVDETIAYFATNKITDFVDMFGEDVPWHDILPLQIAFEKRYEEYEKVNSLA